MSVIRFPMRIRSLMLASATIAFGLASMMELSRAHHISQRHAAEVARQEYKLQSFCAVMLELREQLARSRPSYCGNMRRYLDTVESGEKRARARIAELSYEPPLAEQARTRGFVEIAFAVASGLGFVVEVRANRTKLRKSRPLLEAFDGAKSHN